MIDHDFNEYFVCGVISTLFVLLVTLILLKWWRFMRALEKVDKLDGRYIFVTGCDSGFGEELCIELDRLGCHVFAGCLTDEGMVNIKDRCSSKVFPIQLDVRHHNSIQRCLQEIRKLIPKNKGLWGLVNNAGICGAVGPTQWLNAGDFKEVLETNLLGAIDVTLSTLPLLKSENKYESCRIVSMTSIMAQFISPGALPYCISKSSLMTFCNCLRLELSYSKIHVSTIQPGAHESNFTKTGLISLQKSWERLSSEEKNLYGLDYYKRISWYERTFLKIFARKSHRKVIEAYIHALLSKAPSRNYIVGYDANVMCLLSLYFPNFILDFLFRITGVVCRPLSS
ncbi:hypothetical protein HELRODRAFT_185473 [Helobdella robusta]|uniref:Uncharacterized protein n=1 Tax=Helobdella robusta TaxID=6412 RepID=T1FMV1_HELRO|nr:hypothetical protein HELRODRAFT_185473 [Helobdella robusta]ESO07404.1 hypothetical protein HELRODRAFT_185473 [Helobdella robusta]